MRGHSYTLWGYRLPDTPYPVELATGSLPTVRSLTAEARTAGWSVAYYRTGTPPRGLSNRAAAEAPTLTSAQRRAARKATS